MVRVPSLSYSPEDDEAEDWTKMAQLGGGYIFVFLVGSHGGALGIELHELFSHSPS